MKRRIRDVVFTFLFISNSSYAIVYTKGDYRQILMKVHPIFQYSMNHMVNNHYSFEHTDIDEVYVFLKLPHRRSHAKWAWCIIKHERNRVLTGKLILKWVIVQNSSEVNNVIDHNQWCELTIRLHPTLIKIFRSKTMKTTFYNLPHFLLWDFLIFRIIDPYSEPLGYSTILNNTICDYWGKNQVWIIFVCRKKLPTCHERKKKSKTNASSFLFHTR